MQYDLVAKLADRVLLLSPHLLVERLGSLSLTCVHHKEHVFGVDLLLRWAQILLRERIFAFSLIRHAIVFFIQHRSVLVGLRPRSLQLHLEDSAQIGLLQVVDWAFVQNAFQELVKGRVAIFLHESTRDRVVSQGLRISDWRRRHIARAVEGLAHGSI